MHRDLIRHDGLLGTSVELAVAAHSGESIARAENVVVGEIERLTGVFSVFDPGSELRRWRAGDVDAGDELSLVLAMADRWQVVTDGAINVRLGAVIREWRRAQESGVLPSREVLAGLAARISGSVLAGDDVTGVDLNAIAKGHIIDLAVVKAMHDDAVVSLMVNAGGDVLHAGAESQRVAIEDPTRPYDNAAPLDVVEISNRAVATSGAARRRWTVAGQQFAQVLDPRTGWPVEGVVQASVIADDLTTADVIATAVVVLGADAGTALVERLGLASLVVSADRTVTRSSRWPPSVSRRSTSRGTR